MPKTPDLLLPEPYLESHPLFKLQVTDIQRWLDSLPKANFGESCRQLQDALIGLNKLRCTPKQRFAALETLRPEVHQLLKGLAPHYLKKPAVLPPQSQRAVDLSNSLNSLLSNGYALVVRGLEQKSGFLQRVGRLREVSIHRALAEHSLLQLRCLQLHGQEERHFWLYLHRLYFFAVVHDLEHKQVKDSILGDSSVQACYLRPLMMSTANPYQLAQNQLDTLYRLLPTWAEKLELHGGSAAKWKEGAQQPKEEFMDCLFVFSPLRDTPPAYQVLSDEDAGCIGIHTDALMAELVNLKSTLLTKAAPNQEGLDAHLLMHLMSVWSAMKKRRFERKPRQEKIDIAFGFTSAHFFVAGNLYFEDFVRRAGSANAEVVERAEFFLGVNQDVEHISYGGNEPAKAFGVSKHYKLHCVELRDSSTRGYCVLLPEKEAPHLHKDDLVSLREEGQQHWSVGVIRWIRQKAGDQFEAGIDLLGAAVEPYQAKLARLDVAAGKVKMAFVFPHDVLTGQPQRILLESNLYHSDDVLLVESPGQSLVIELGDRLETVGRYELFAYESLELGDQESESMMDGQGEGLQS